MTASSSEQPDPTTIMVVDGRWMFAKNLQTEAGYEIDSLDAPVLMGQLVCKLLSFAAPSPQTISGKQQFSHVEQSRKITVTTMSAGGEYGTPWHLAGTVERKSSAEVAFDLKFSFPNERGRTMLHLSGTWSGAARQKISDSTSLEGWTAYSLGPQKRPSEGGTIVDYGAAQSKSSYHSVGELRAHISAR